jgi:ArsR family transcriptional regulator
MIDQGKMLLFQKQAEVIKATAHPLRIAILDFLHDGPQCVCDIAEHVGSERSNVSRHLSVMVSAGVLESEKDGLKVMYRLKTPCILNFLACVSDVIRHQIKADEDLLKAM